MNDYAVYIFSSIFIHDYVQAQRIACAQCARHTDALGQRAAADISLFLKNFITTLSIVSIFRSYGLLCIYFTKKLMT